MAISHAQTTRTANVSGATTTLNVVLTNNPANGDLVCIGAQYFNASTNQPATFTVADAAGKTYTKSTKSPSSTQSAAAGFAYIFFLNNASGANSTITATFTSPGAGGSVEIFADDFTVAGGTTSVSSDTIGSSSTGGTINTPTVVVSGTTDLVYGFAAVAQVVSTVPSPWTLGAIGGHGNATGYILSRNSNVAFNWTQVTAGQWDSIGQDFIFTASGGASKGMLFPNPLTGIGVGNRFFGDRLSYSILTDL